MNPPRSVPESDPITRNLDYAYMVDWSGLGVDRDACADDCSETFVDLEAESRLLELVGPSTSRFGRVVLGINEHGDPIVNEPIRAEVSDAIKAKADLKAAGDEIFGTQEKRKQYYGDRQQLENMVRILVSNVIKPEPGSPIHLTNMVKALNALDLSPSIHVLANRGTKIDELTHLLGYKSQFSDFLSKEEMQKKGRRHYEDSTELLTIDDVVEWGIDAGYTHHGYKAVVQIVKESFGGIHAFSFDCGRFAVKHALTRDLLGNWGAEAYLQNGGDSSALRNRNIMYLYSKGRGPRNDWITRPGLYESVSEFRDESYGRYEWLLDEDRIRKPSRLEVIRERIEHGDIPDAVTGMSGLEHVILRRAAIFEVALDITGDRDFAERATQYSRSRFLEVMINHRKTNLGLIENTATTYDCFEDLFPEITKRRFSHFNLTLPNDRQ